MRNIAEAKVVYDIEYLSYKLGVSTSTVQEIKGKLKIKGKVTEEDYIKMSKFVECVKHLYKKVTLSTINNYLYYQGVKLDEHTKFDWEKLLDEYE